MDEDELVAPSEATEAEAIIETGQEDPPAEVEETPAEKTDSQKRRERRAAQVAAQNTRILEEKAETDRKLQEAENRLSRIKRSAQGLQEPKEADFADVIEYAVARGLWKQSQVATQTQEREVTEEVEHHRNEANAFEAARMRERQNAFETAKVDARTRYADFDKVALSDSVPITPAVASIILDSDQPADVAYHLGKHPELALAISKMPPMAAAREIGRIEATLSMPQPKLRTDAPTPINPVRASGSPVRDAESLSNEDYRRARMSGQLK